MCVRVRIINAANEVIVFEITLRGRRILLLLPGDKQVLLRIDNCIKRS